MNLAHPVREWPLNKIGDEAFFGYISGIAKTIDSCAEDKECFIYALFEYGGARKVFRLPNDEKLVTDLIQFLLVNLREPSGTFAKLWIKKTATGYEVDLP